MNRIGFDRGRHNGANPDAGRQLGSWAHQAGITDIQITSFTWTYAYPASRR